ncbi:hypothetical protein CBS147346_6958 [Aspergillus niger]|nr:hypothetical protein CBS147346_6958 [Aspergillus niger]
MGIPFLTRHLYPFAETIVFGEPQKVQRKQTEYVEAVVIDGPSLVYHVSMRLLSLSNGSSQPTCDEVSCAVMVYLLQLSMLGVKIHKICFDGALPDEKRETRLARLERSRKKLVTLRTNSPHCFQKSSSPLRPRSISPKNILQRRSLPAKYANIPENPFIVPAVFEDLKHRWCKKNINSVVKNVPDLSTASLSDFPWGDAVVMVPGEADTYCAHVARLTGCAILTNDSDLLLHDLGKRGSVVLLDSIEPWTTLLDNLPPLSILMRPGHEMAQEFRTGCSVNDHVDRLVKLMGKCSDEDSAQYVARSHTDRDDSVTPPTGMNGFGDVRARRPTRTLANMYELLPEQ